MGNSDSRPNNARATDDASVFASMLGSSVVTATAGASGIIDDRFIQTTDGVNSTGDICIDQSNVDVQQVHVKQKATLNVATAQKQNMTTIINQITDAIAKNLGSNDHADANNYSAVTANMVLKAVTTMSTTCDASANTVFMQKAVRDNTAGSFKQIQQNVLVGSITASCAQDLAAQQSQLQSMSTDMKQTATAKAIGVKSNGIFGELESLLVAGVAVLMVAAVLLAVVETSENVEKIGLLCVVLAYVWAAVMTLIKVFSATILGADNAKTIAACKANAQQYDDAFSSPVYTRPYLFRKNWYDCQSHRAANSIPLTGFVVASGVAPVENVHYSDVQTVFERVRESTKTKKQPVCAAIWVRYQPYETSAIAYVGAANAPTSWDGYWKSKDTNKQEMFTCLQRASIRGVNSSKVTLDSKQYNASDGSLHFYTLPSAVMPSPNPNKYCDCTTSETIGGIASIPSTAALEAPSAPVHVVDSDGDVSNVFTQMPYPISIDMDMTTGKNTVSEQSVVLGSSQKGVFTTPVPQQDTAAFSPLNVCGAIDVVALPWVKLNSSGDDMDWNGSISNIATYAAWLQKINKPRNASNFTNIAPSGINNRTLLTEASQTTIEMNAPNVALLPQPMMPGETAAQYRAKNRDRTNTITPTWVYGGEMITDPKASLESVANTMVQFAVPDLRTMQPVGITGESAVTYRHAMDQKIENMQTAMVLYAGVYVGIFALNGAMLYLDIFPKEKLGCIITLVLGGLGGLGIGVAVAHGATAPTL